MLYWLCAVLGVVDIDILDVDVPDGDFGAAANATSNLNGLAGLLLKLGLNAVPLTIIISLVALIGWALCYFVVHFLFRFVADGLFRYLFGLPVFIGTLYAAIMTTAALIRPLRPLFNSTTQHTVKLVLGQTAIVRTSRVDENFGEVNLADGGAGLILKVRAETGQTLTKGERVVLLDRRGKDGLICRDHMRADITVAFYLRVNETPEDVLKVAKSIGAERASDRAAINLLFAAKFSEALKTVGKQVEFVQLFENRQQFREKIIEVIGDDLNGYVLEDVAIDHIEQTPKAALDASNIRDAEGIRKITELTAAQNIRTNILERDEELAIKKKNVETIEAMLELERQHCDAEARQKREVLTIGAREEAETKKIQE